MVAVSSMYALLLTVFRAVGSDAMITNKSRDFHDFFMFAALSFLRFWYSLSWMSSRRCGTQPANDVPCREFCEAGIWHLSHWIQKWELSLSHFFQTDVLHVRLQADTFANLPLQYQVVLLVRITTTSYADSICSSRSHQDSIPDSHHSIHACLRHTPPARVYHSAGMDISVAVTFNARICLCRVPQIFPLLL